MPSPTKTPQSRAPYARMMAIHERIKSGRFPNSTLLGQEMEVDPRTIKRDIDFMRDRLNLPIEYDPRRYGFYYSRPVDQFPNAPITEAEMFALLVANKVIAQYQGTAFAQPLEVAFRKMTAQLNDQNALSLGALDQALSFRPFAPDETDLQTFETLSQALQQRRRLQFVYRNLGAEKAQTRRVDPYHLACVDNRWYLIAFDTARKALRKFALTRMRRVTLRKELFERPADFRIEEYLKGAFGIFQSGEDVDVVVDFDGWAAELVRERRWHPSQQLEDQADGGVRLRMRLNSLTEVERWILSWGVHATVIHPERLKESLLATAERLRSRYGAG